MKFRNAFIGLIAAATALLAPAGLSAETPVSAESTGSSAVAARPALWKVSDADTTIYLFGTIHLLPKGVEWYDGKIASAFEQSHELVTEIPEVPQGEMVAMMVKHGALPEGQNLRDMMTLDERTRYEAAMKGIGLPEGAFDRYKPWFAAMALATAPLQKAGYSIDNGIENQLNTRNKALGRPRGGLETLDFQLGIFDRLGADAQKAYLFDVIDSIPTIPQEIGKMVDAWSKGDARGLADLLNAATNDPALYKALLTDRNRNWATWIDDRLDQPGVVFVAVGAGHLGGKESVQELLHKQGVKAVRVQ